MYANKDLWRAGIIPRNSQKEVYTTDYKLLLKITLTNFVANLRKRKNVENSENRRLNRILNQKKTC